MFDNIGGKIKGVASAISWIGIILSIVIGISMLAIYENLFGLLIAFLGSFVSWISSFVLYGFGELIDKTVRIEKLLSDGITVGERKNKEISVEKNNTSYKKNINLPNEDATNGDCEMCGNKNTSIYYVKIVDEMGTRYRNVCAECLDKYNCYMTKQ